MSSEAGVSILPSAILHYSTADFNGLLNSQLEEAKGAYSKVLEIDSRSSAALGFLGLVYHLMDRIHDAIVKYHEVRLFSIQSNHNSYSP